MISEVSYITEFASAMLSLLVVIVNQLSGVDPPLPSFPFKLLPLYGVG
jgi:hypothetical protein